MMEPTPALLLVIALTDFLPLASALPPQILLLRSFSSSFVICPAGVCVWGRGSLFHLSEPVSSFLIGG